MMGVATKSDSRESIVQRHHPVGASTGYMQSLRGDWSAQVEEAWRVSSFAIELSALSESELPSLAEYLRQTPSLPFRYVSIHGPSKGRQMDEEELVAALVQLSGLADAIVMHPDTMDGLALYRPLGHKLLLENMDSRKPDGRTPQELHRTFAELPEAGFCFDIAHAWSVDPSMAVAGELLDSFRARLRHVHLSSLSEDLHHVSLTDEDEELFSPVLKRCLDVPWIFEAPPQTDSP
jgi:Xylose isomerase-like TIM barrel